MSREEVRIEFIEEMEKEQIQTEHLEDSGRQGQVSSLLGVGVFIEDCGLVCMSSQASRNQLEQNHGPRYPSWVNYSLEPEGLGI